MGRWDSNLDALLAGASTGEGSTILAGECVHFPWDFDAENKLETDSGQNTVVIAGSVLHAKSSLAERFVTPTQELTDPDGKVWLVREVLKVDDGALSNCSLVAKTNVPRPPVPV